VPQEQSVPVQIAEMVQQVTRGRENKVRGIIFARVFSNAFLAISIFSGTGPFKSIRVFGDLKTVNSNELALSVLS